MYLDLLVLFFLIVNGFVCDWGAQNHWAVALGVHNHQNYVSFGLCERVSVWVRAMGMSHTT